MEDTMTGDPRRPQREKRPTYHLRNIVLDLELVDRIDSWHGGMNTMVYSLASTGREELVSPSMCDAAADELEQPSKFPRDEETQADLDDLIATLRDLADYPDESTAEAYGLDSTDSGYATWLMDSDEKETLYV
jgi:hypothetical protein